jgi:hypothetical protein
MCTVLICTVLLERVDDMWGRTGRAVSCSESTAVGGSSYASSSTVLHLQATAHFS